jgi:CRP/FNR family transcriptional regulator, cyclic AMP receptor protein
MRRIEPHRMLPKVSQETLASRVGTTRSRVNFFMNKFRQLGFIEYNGEIKDQQALADSCLAPIRQTGFVVHRRYAR